MPKINELPRASALSAADLLAVESTSGDDTRSAPGSLLRDYILGGFNSVDVWEGIVGYTNRTVNKAQYVWNGSVCTVTTPDGATSNVSACILFSSQTLPSSFVPGETYYVKFKTTDEKVKLRIIFKDATGNQNVAVVYCTGNDSITVPSTARIWTAALYIASGVTLTTAVTVSDVHFLSAKSNYDLSVDTTNIFTSLSQTVSMRGTLADNTDLDTVKTPGIWLLSAGYSYAHAPQPTGYAAILCVFPSSNLSAEQVVYTLTVSALTALHCYVRSEYQGSYGSTWKQMDGMASYGVIPNNTNLDIYTMSGNWVLQSGYTYTHSPISSSQAGLLTVFPGSANTIVQIVFSLSKTNVNNIHMYARCAIGGSFDTDGTYIDWKQIDGGGNTYNNTYTTEYYDNTYNITCSPTITADTNNYLASTGNYTDRTGDIQAMLNSTGVCHLGPGRFSVTGIEIPEYGALIGSGPRTALILDASVTEGYAVKLKTQSAVYDMRITSLSAPQLSQNVGTRHGVLFEGTANAQTSPQTFKRSRVSGCIISNFTGGGITCRNTGLSPASSLVISDCQIFSCNAGVNIPFFSEFHRITNVTAQECYYGCVCNGGNNNFVNCDFSANKIALLIDNSTGQSRNDTHGTFSACSFHHSDNTYENGVIVSVGTAIRILGASAGEIFTGCQIGFGNLEIDDSVGIRFDACNFLRMTALGVTDSPLVVFSDCTFYDANSSPLTQSGNTALKFTDCYLRSGAVYDPMA